MNKVHLIILKALTISMLRRCNCSKPQSVDTGKV